MDTETANNQEATPTPEGEDDSIGQLVDAACGVLISVSEYNVVARIAFTDGRTPADVLDRLAHFGFADGPLAELFALLTHGCGEIAIAHARYQGEGFMRDSR